MEILREPRVDRLHHIHINNTTLQWKHKTFVGQSLDANLPTVLAVPGSNPIGIAHIVNGVSVHSVFYIR